MSTKNRSLKLIIFITICGCILGSVLKGLFTYIIPADTIIRGFLIDTTYWVGIPDDFKIDLGVFKTAFSFQFEVGILSILGIFMSWYFLRYFR